MNKIKIQNEETPRAHRERVAACGQAHPQAAQGELAFLSQTAAAGPAAARPDCCAPAADESGSAHPGN